MKSSCHLARYTPWWSAKQLLLSYNLFGLIGYITHSRQEVDGKTADTTSSVDHEAAKISLSPTTLLTRHHVIIFAGKRKFFSARVKETFNSISSYQLQQLLMVSGDFECNPGPDKVKGKRVKFARVALEQLLAASFNFPSKIKKWMSGISLSGDKRYVLNRYLCLLAKSFKTWQHHYYLTQ